MLFYWLHVSDLIRSHPCMFGKCYKIWKSPSTKKKITEIVLFSSPEPYSQGELLPLANVRRPSCVVRRASSTICFKHLLCHHLT